MEAPKVLKRSKLNITFLQQPPRLVRWGFHPSPANPLMIGLTDGNVVCRIEFTKGRKASAILKAWQKAWPKTEFVQDEAATAKSAKLIFNSKTALQLKMVGTTFQQAVWKVLLKIPSGKTMTYGEVAKAIKNPKAVRAVGTACGANPIPLLVPCHRVVASNGGLGGFGGGLPLKERLLLAEGALAR